MNTDAALALIKSLALPGQIEFRGDAVYNACQYGDDTLCEALRVASHVTLVGDGGWNVWNCVNEFDENMTIWLEVDGDILAIYGFFINR